MTKGRLEAFSDGVVAILITIMILDLHVPHGSDLHALRPVLPHFLIYVLSFIFLGIYWSNHHHMFHAVHHVNGAILWANLHLLFWLSLVPLAFVNHLISDAIYVIVALIWLAPDRRIESLLDRHDRDSELPARKS